MPRIFDNIDELLLPALRETLEGASRADFCVGYFNLRGWKNVDDIIERWPGGDAGTCRLLVGMQRLPDDMVRDAYRLGPEDELIDNRRALELRRELAAEFRRQLTLGFPTNGDEAALHRLTRQLRDGKLVVKLFLRHTLHAKLYLGFRDDPVAPIVGYVGSSNLTLPGLAKQGELNVDVVDWDAANKLARWFQARWEDRWAIDISAELAEILEASWARPDPLDPYLIYLKIAYHLSQDARAGLQEFRVPTELRDVLFDFQTAAVRIAARHVLRHGGVMLGDVVGLGKTLMATALAKVMEEDLDFETLIICPKNLVSMWEDYCAEYRLRARVVSLSRVQNTLPSLRRHRLVIIDESHNLRNREGVRYRAIAEYIRENDSKVVLLSATPYNKTYLDLANQLRLFVPEDLDLGVRPERLLRETGETVFLQRHQAPLRSLAAFEKSPYAADWQELMRLFLVRRTRSFIQQNYASLDEEGRSFLTLASGERTYFPARVPRTIELDVADETQYARLYSEPVVEAINALRLPRYGLAGYVRERAIEHASATEARALQDLSRAGTRLKGFSRTTLFKRLESGGNAFLQSVQRHVIRNYVFLYALERGLPLPLGRQLPNVIDPIVSDDDLDLLDAPEEDDDGWIAPTNGHEFQTDEELWGRAAELYTTYSEQFATRFRWVSSSLFDEALRDDLRRDVATLRGVLGAAGPWRPADDPKLNALQALLDEIGNETKVLVFSQFADTVDYLVEQLERRGVERIAGATGNTANVTELAWRFSPISNNRREAISPEQELRVLVATDVLSEGQNLQDCSVVVNYDLPWAIIKLVQRAGRVDRIGQRSREIHVYSMLPADGVERVIRLRDRVRERLRENAEVVGTDEAFFEGEESNAALVDLYHEKADVLEDDGAAGDVDLDSYAYQIWKNALDANPALERIVPELPFVSYSAKHAPEPMDDSVLVYARTQDGADSLAWLDARGEVVTENQFAILRAASCEPDEPAVKRSPQHHELVEEAVRALIAEAPAVGGQLGRPSGARYRVYTRLRDYLESTRGTLFERPDLARALAEIYRAPLRQQAIDTLNRQLRAGINDGELADLVTSLRDQDRLTVPDADVSGEEAQIICSLGLRASS